MSEVLQPPVSPDAPSEEAPTGLRARVKRWLDRTRPLHGPVLLVAGVLYDFLTLRIDRLFDNVFLGVYLLAFALATVLQLRVHLKTGVPGWLERRVHWVHNLGQFLLGGLLSAYLIYYFRGAPLLRGAVWLTVLGVGATVNELLPRWLKLPELWTPLLTVLAFHYVLAAGPVLTGTFIGTGLPLLVATLLAAGVHALSTVPWPGQQVDLLRIRRLLVGSTMGVGLAIFLELAAWKADLIPPLPLTLMGSEVVPEQHEAYEAGFLRQALASVGVAPKLQWTPGLRVLVKTPVYLPKAMSTTILHVWEHYDEAAGWQRTDAIRLDITGGRKEGYRTYSRKRQLKPGHWRVRVTTSDERELGRVRFDLVEAPVSEPAAP